MDRKYEITRVITNMKPTVRVKLLCVVATEISPLADINFDKTITEEWKPAELGLCILAEREKTGSGISCHS